MPNPVDYAISHARLTIATLLFLLVAGLRRLCDDPEGSRAGRHDPDHLCACHAARHQPGGCRAAAAAADRDPAQVGRRTSRRCARPPSRAAAMCCSNSRPASTPTSRSPMCAPRSTTPSATCRATPTSRRCTEVNLSLFPVLVVALAGDVPERTLLQLARARPRPRSSRCRACSSADLRGARDEAVEIIAEPMLLNSYGVSLDS